MAVHLIRHGETEWSLAGRHTGRTEVDLTPDGEGRARELVPVLAATVFSRVLVSPRLRARRTAELAGLGRAARVDPELAEWDYGEYEGLRTVEIRARRPGWDVWRDGCPGGESPADVSRRADRVIERLSEATGESAVFSHGQFGRALAARWIGLPVAEGRHFAMDPASRGILAHGTDHPQRRVIALWNATGR